ncbi:hypothetical protein TWF132_006379 [Orbilia oligospora]|nr:hypothetical protein TWF132_006379 [Orbilia oligospora]
MDRYSASMLIDDIQTINRKLGGNPFALNMLGAATHSTGLSEGRNNIPRPPNGSRTIGFQKDDFLAYANGPEHEEAEHILSVVNLAFGIMELKSRASITGLKILGHFNPIGITSTVLSDMILGGHGGWMYICDSGDQDEQQLDAEVRSFSEYNGNVWDILRFFGILNSSVNTETNQSRLLPHPIIRTWIQRHMSAAQVVKCVLFLGKSLSHFRILLHSWPMSWPELFNGEMASQLRCCFRHMEQLGFLDPGPENPFVKHQDSVLVPEGLAAGFKLFGDFQRCLKLSKLELDLWNDNSTLWGSSSLFELIRKISKGYWETRNPEKGLEMVQQAIDIDRGDVNPRLRDFQKKEVLYQKEQMQYQLAKLNGELDEDLECISDSEYELLDDEVVDILDLVSGKHEAGKLVEIISHSLNCDPADYDPDVLFQLLRFDIDLDTEEAVSLEAELIIKAFKSFIKNNADLGWCDHRRNTILHIAVKGNHSLIVELLLKYSFRFDINATDFTGMTPLAFAVTMGSRKSTELLIQAGAELDFRPWSTSPPLLFRALSTDIELEFLRYLLESGLRDNINEPHLNYGTILHHAAFRRSASVVALLLEYGADANAVDYVRLTPLALAVMLGYADGVLELLLARRIQTFMIIAVDIQASYNVGVTLLHRFDIPILRDLSGPRPCDYQGNRERQRFSFTIGFGRKVTGLGVIFWKCQARCIIYLCTRNSRTLQYWYGDTRRLYQWIGTEESAPIGVMVVGKKLLLMLPLSFVTTVARPYFALTVAIGTITHLRRHEGETIAIHDLMSS